MNKIHTQDELTAAILLLEKKQSEDWLKLKDELFLASENLKPLSIIKNTLKDVELIPILKNKLLSGAVGIAAGYLSKNILVGSTHNPLKQLLGAIIETEVSSSIINEPAKVQILFKMIKKLFSKSKTTQYQENGIAQL